MSPKNQLNIHDILATVRGFIIWITPLILALETPLGNYISPEFAPIISIICDMLRRYRNDNTK